MLTTQRDTQKKTDLAVVNMKNNKSEKMPFGVYLGVTQTNTHTHIQWHGSAHASDERYIASARARTFDKVKSTNIIRWFLLCISSGVARTKSISVRFVLAIVFHIFSRRFEHQTQSPVVVHIEQIYCVCVCVKRVNKHNRRHARASHTTEYSRMRKRDLNAVCVCVRARYIVDIEEVPTRRMERAAVECEHRVK